MTFQMEGFFFIFLWKHFASIFKHNNAEIQNNDQQLRYVNADISTDD